MYKEKIKITIEIDKNLHYRIQDVINYYNLGHRFKDVDRDLRTEQDFIIGSIVNFLEYVEVFAYPPKHVELLNQDKRPLKNTVKMYLKKHKIKQRELAQTIGMDEGTLSNILNNNVQPSMDSFIKIWAALNYPPLDELIYRQD